MGYTPDNNPYIPGDPYSYDLKWQVDNIKHMQARFEELDDQVQEATDQADRATLEADRAKEQADTATQQAESAAGSAEAAAGSATEAAGSATDAAGSAAEAKDYADNIGDPVSGIVTEWLNNHVTPGYAVDASLMISGAAADAKVTGDAIRKINAAIPSDKGYTNKYIALSGNIRPDYFYCLSPVEKVKAGDTITAADGYQFWLGFYDLIDGAYVFNNRQSEVRTSYTAANNVYVRILVQKISPNFLITPDEAAAAISSTGTLESIFTLDNALAELSDRITENDTAIDDNLFPAVILTNNSIANDGSTPASNYRCLTSIFRTQPGDVLELADGYFFRLAIYTRTDEDTYVFDSFPSGDWLGIRNFNKSNYYRAIIRKGDGSSLLSVEEARTAIIQKPADLPITYTLKDKIEADEQNIAEINNALPTGYVIYRGSMTNEGELVESERRCRTDIIEVHEGEYITLSDMEFRFARYTKNPDDTYNFVALGTEWYSERTFINDGYIRLLFRKAPDPTEKLLPEYVSDHIINTNIDIPTEYSLKSRLDVLENAVENLWNSEVVDNKINIALSGNQNMMWSYPLSIFPMCQYLSRVRNQLYWSFTSADGYSGVAAYDIDSGRIYKINLKHGAVDDHNPVAVLVRSNGDIIAAYSYGHNTGNNVYFRKATTKECIDNFTQPYKVNTSGVTSYAQLLEYNGVIYCFYRENNMNWKMITSSDDGNTWQAAGTIITADIQYYCKFKPTTTPGLIRLVAYSNPGATDPRIRMGFLDLASGNILNADNSTVLGTTAEGVAYTDFTVMIAPPTGKTQRFFDAAITDPAITSLLYCTFSESESGDSDYKWFNNGTIIDIVGGGQSLWNPKYQLGMIFLDTQRIALARGLSGADRVEVWSLGDTPEMVKLLYEEARGSAGIRNGRPICDDSGRFVLWHRGYYNPNVYTDFNADAAGYDLTEDKLIFS